MKKLFLLIIVPYFLVCTCDAGGGIGSIIVTCFKKIIEQEHGYATKNGVLHVGKFLKVDLHKFGGGKPVRLVKKIDPCFGTILQICYADESDRNQYNNPVLGTVYLTKS